MVWGEVGGVHGNQKINLPYQIRRVNAFPLDSDHLEADSIGGPASSRYLADVLLQAPESVHAQHEPEFQRAEPPTQRDLPVLRADEIREDT